MKLTLYEKISAWFGSLTGFYSYGQRKNEPGVYINHAIAKNFGLINGMMSETALDEFVMCSIGGVNGRKMRHGEQLMFKRHDGNYSAVTYEPMRDKTRGYVHEIKVKTTDECLPLSALPNFSRLKSNAEYRAGDLFCVISITPYENRGETFDYACIAEFFDALRQKCEKPAIHWLGGREYVVMLKPEQKPGFEELCQTAFSIDGRAVMLSVSKAYIESDDTADAQTGKIAFCLKKLRNVLPGGEYVFDRFEFDRSNSFSKGEALLKRINECELSFLPVIAVKSGDAKYFYVMPKDKTLTDAAVQAGLVAELDAAILRKLVAGIIDKKYPCMPYSVPIFGMQILAKELQALADETKAPVYVELRARALRVEDKLAKASEQIKSVGAIPAISDPAMQLCELSAVQRMGFEVIRVFGMDIEKLKECSDFCRTFSIECATYGVDSDEEFIALRRIGLDLCAGDVLSEAVDVPEKMHFCEPLVLCDAEEKEPEEPETKKEPEPFDFSRFTAKALYNAFSTEINKMIGPKKCEPMKKMERAEKTEKLDRIDESGLEACEYEKGIGAKNKKSKNPEKEKSDKAKKKLQKKEIKKGRLKKIKLEKK